MKNIGDIDAVFSYMQSESPFGQQFEFTPSQGIIIPGGYQAIQVLLFHGAFALPMLNYKLRYYSIT